MSQFEIRRRETRCRELEQIPICLAESMGAAMPYTVIWYGRKGIIDKVTFDAEKMARDHAIAMFQTRKSDDGVISVEVRKDSGAVVFSHAEN